MKLRELVRTLAGAVGLAGPRVGVGESWAGESVVYTKPAHDIRFGNFVESEPVWFPFSGQLPVTAVEDSDGFLRIRDGVQDGWVLKVDFMLAGDAPAYLRRLVRTNPEDFWAHGTLALILFQAGEYREAIRGYDEYIRRDATLPGMFINRGHCYFGMGDFGGAIRNYDEAIRLDPAWAQAFLARGNARARKHELDNACQDYVEAARLDPVAAKAYFKHPVPREVTRGPDVVKSFQTALELQGYRCASSVYAVILGHLAAGQAGDGESAERFLTDSAGKLDAAWPEPAVRFLRGDLDEPELLKLATDDDQRTEARCYLGMHYAIRRRPAEALAHLRWVKEYGAPGCETTDMAMAELDRLDAAAKP